MDQLKADINDWVSLVDNFKRRARRDTKRLVDEVMLAILSLGGFDKLGEDSQLTPHDEAIQPWIEKFNEFVREESALPGPDKDTGMQPDSVYIQFLDKHSEIINWLAEGTWQDYCGSPVRNGLIVCMANTPNKPDDPLNNIRKRFRSRYYKNINEGYEYNPKKYLTAMMRSARLVREGDPYAPLSAGTSVDSWVEIGAYLLDRGIGTRGATIEKRGHWRDEKQGKAVSIWHVIIYPNVEKVAYKLWEEAGYPQGRDMDFWFAAEKSPPKLFPLVDIYDINAERRKLSIFINTMIGSNSYTLVQERRAISKLRRMITKEQYERYMVTGIFKEKSPKSGVTYFLRRSRPTLAFREQKGVRGLEWRFLAGLCMHPGAYYLASFAGSHCPTDDLINHLQFIRADERRFWSKANHHRQEEVEIGLP